MRRASPLAVPVVEAVVDPLAVVLAAADVGEDGVDVLPPLGDAGVVAEAREDESLDPLVVASIGLEVEYELEALAAAEDVGTLGTVETLAAGVEPSFCEWDVETEGKLW